VSNALALNRIVEILAAKLFVAYLLGSLSGSLIVGRLRGVDIRTQGSGNAGGTNAFRTQGAAFALAAVAIDIGKGALAAGLGYWPPDAPAIAPLLQALACGFAAILGHAFPVFFGFRGGKGAGVAVGVLAVVFPMCLLPLLLLWLVSLTLTGYVGLSTILAALALPLVAWWLGPPIARAELVQFCVLYAVAIVLLHRSNLARLRAGTEHRFDKARVLARLLRLP
jgi:glycerol-3-phosphate acyltransferase PlsY